MAVNRLAESEGVGLFSKAIKPWHLCYNCYTSLLKLELHSGSLIPRPPPSFPSLAVRFTVLQATGSWAGALGTRLAFRVIRTDEGLLVLATVDQLCVVVIDG